MEGELEHVSLGGMKLLSGRGMRLLAACLICITMITGCAFQNTIDRSKEEVTNIDYKLLEAPELDYEIPVSYPGILVSRNGYSSVKSKIVYFQGSELPETYQLVEEESGKVVYTGKVQEIYFSEEENEYSGAGDFTEFTQIGTYYIKCDILGYSYSFPIKEDNEKVVFQQVQAWINEQQVELTNASVLLTTESELDQWVLQSFLMLLSYELYPEAYEDGDKDSKPDIFQTLDTMVRYFVKIQDSNPENTVYSYGMAAVLAKYSYLYQNFDNSYANDVLKAADTMWRLAEKALEEGKAISEEYRILAAAELYRATGQTIYGDILEIWGLDWEMSRVVDTHSMPNNLAAITYISTKKKVDMEICSQLMTELMRETEVIVQQLNGMDQITQPSMTTLAMDEFMWNLVILTIVEYVISNHEYGSVLEQQHIYISGRNKISYCFWSLESQQEENDVEQTTDTERSDKDSRVKVVAENKSDETVSSIRIQDNPVWTAAYLLTLSEMVNQK